VSLEYVRDWKKQGKEKYAQRAQRILERWEPLFNSKWGTRKWAIKGLFCVVYVGQKDCALLRHLSSRMVTDFRLFGQRFAHRRELWRLHLK
jgi:hypothetical protein